MPLADYAIKSPLVTLYILNYNYGEYIVQAIESALGQGFSDFELIIIDDGSTDDSREKVRPYEGRENITVIYQANKGLTTAANVALKLARGKYFMRLDADDWLKPQALTALSAEMEKDPGAVYIFPDYWLTDKQGNDYQEVSAVETFPDQNPATAPPHGACTMIRTATLRSSGSYDESILKHDGDDLYRKLGHQGTILPLKQRLFHYRQHGRNFSRD